MSFVFKYAFIVCRALNANNVCLKLKHTFQNYWDYFEVFQIFKIIPLEIELKFLFLERRKQTFYF
jgi:hypothetical protein